MLPIEGAVHGAAEMAFLNRLECKDNASIFGVVFLL
jgi:hypothetical protein